MKYRKRVSRGKSRRMFTKTSRVHKKNAMSGMNSRGGIRL
jgi:hypothetical protein